MILNKAKCNIVTPNVTPNVTLTFQCLRALQTKSVTLLHLTKIKLLIH
jgi:hypothetical protein